MRKGEYGSIGWRGTKDEPESESIFLTQFLEFGHDAVGDARDALGVESIHHAFDHIDAILEGEVDEIGVDDDSVRRDEGFVVRQEEGGGERSATMYVQSAGASAEGTRAYTWRVSASFLSASFLIALS